LCTTDVCPVCFPFNQVGFFATMFTTRMSIVLCLCIAVCSAAPALRQGHAKSQFDDWEAPHESQVYVKSSTIAKVFSDGVRNESMDDEHVIAMESAMRATYKALPKNKQGLLPHSAAAYLVQKYVTNVYHYSIRGLGPDPTGTETDASQSSSSRRQASAPEKLQSLLESRHAGQGLALRDAASLAVMMNSLVMDHDVALMYQAFESLTVMNMLPQDEEELSIPNVVKVIQAWQWLHRHDFQYEPDLFVDHMLVPVHAMYEFGTLAQWFMEAKFYREQHILNPFKAKTLSIADTLQLAHTATAEMGEWQDHDCKSMKRYLIKLDPDGNGRVLLDALYKEPEQDDEHGEQVFRFSESQDYLRSIGGLDESNPSQPQVLISNYMLGPANCYRSTAFHTFCCLNECDAVLTEVERALGSPFAKPDVLLPLLGNLTTTSMDEVQPVSTSLVEKLSSVAARNGGEVPLHGRLFTQWLHFAFPYECPYPHVTQKDGAGNALTTSYFQGTSDGSQWTDDEMLPLIEEEHGGFFGFRGILRVVFMLLALVALFNQIRVLAVAHARNLQKTVIGVDLEKCV